jgi:N-acetyl-anhydromuramyl-L-alanine amidase AmpD
MSHHIAVASPNFNKRPAGVTVSVIVLHADASDNAQASVSWIKSKESKVSYHALVDRDGTVYTFVEPSQRAWHAGVSAFDGQKDANNFSLGLSFANKCDGKEPYTEAQYWSGAAVVREWMQLYPAITLDRITTHEAIALPAGRKHDPGPLFDVPRFLALCGELPLAA